MNEDPGYRRDNPGGEWLQRKIDAVAEAQAKAPRTSHRSNRIGGAPTAYFKRAFFLPTDMVASLPGASNEMRKPGDAQYDALDAIVRKEGFKADQDGNAILIEVNDLGQPFITEGNTRAAIAKAMGVERLRVEVRWLNGGERVDGPFTPAKVIAAATPDHIGFNEDAPLDQRQYEMLREIFIGQLGGVDHTALTERELMRTIIAPLQEIGMTRAEVVEVAPFLLKFASDLKAGRIVTAQPKATDSRAEMQAAADKVRPIAGDRENIGKTLPLLLPEQQDDVAKAEVRFAKGAGFMLTNSTGTGKTFSGMGTVKRFAQMGKTNTLIIAPNDAVIAGWVKAGNDMGLDVKPLSSTKDAGEGIVITTYANLGSNTNLAGREWDLVVADEAQNLMDNKAGADTKALEAFRAITNKPSDLWRKAEMLRADQWDAWKKMKDGEPKTREHRRLTALRQKDEAILATKPRSKALMLSATPFGRDKNVDYAEGYLFDYPPDGRIGNSNQSGQNAFMVSNFGYRIRYHKLTKPETAVDSAVFEREFHDRLVREGVLSGRQLHVDVDYDRKFVTVADAIGTKIDAVLADLREGASSTDKAMAEGYRSLQKDIEGKFTYLKRMQLLEAIKAKAAVPDIQKHLALGRKVVVFHDYNVGGGFNPFEGLRILDDANAIKALADLMGKHPDLDRLDFSSYGAPMPTLLSALGKQAKAFNGTVSKAQRMKNLTDFNTDGSGVDVLIVQAQAGGAGISMHDITGVHQRVLINLGMPTRPTTTLQEEGRGLRVGTKTNVAMRYYTIGTAWERQAFARRIADDSGAVENLALGSGARAIRDGFIDAYMDAGPMEPSAEDGTGGKAKDRATSTTSPYERAKTHYFGRMKVTGRRDQREGIDFYPTPEPLAFKMVEWAGIRNNERVLEPSVGDGSIARYMPEGIDLTMIEPSADLASRALLRAPQGKTVESTFEAYHLANKHHVVVMNPPFGAGGKTAMDHLAKAARHVREGGRIVALVPTGPAADKHWDAWYHGKDAEGFALRAIVSLPHVAFEKANTHVMTRVMILDRLGRDNMGQAGDLVSVNMTGSATIANLFDRLQDISVPARPMPQVDAATELENETLSSEPKTVTGPALVSEVEAFEPATFTSNAGKKFPAVKHPARVERALYDRLAALAKAHGGWWAKGARNEGPTFAFRNDEAVKRFLEDVRKPVAGFEEPAYHGTPHDFDRFSLGFMGTGEGNQAFGWGLYFAGNKSVAEYYRKQQSDRRSMLMVDGEKVDAGTGSHADRTAEQRAAVMVRAAVVNGMPIEAAFRHAQRNVREAEMGDLTTFQKEGGWGDVEKLQDVVKVIEGWIGKDIKINEGKLLTVEVPDADALLDWNAVMADQPPAIKEALKSSGILKDFKNGMSDFASPQNARGKGRGENLYAFLTYQLGSDRAASERLREVGILGHRFKAGTIAGATNAGTNYVIYDDAAIQITAREQRIPPQVTAEATFAAEEIQRMMPMLRDELDRLDLRRVTLRYAPGQTWQGQFNATAEGDMEILIGAALDPLKTLHHEALHAMRHINLFTDQEWAAMEAEALGWKAKPGEAFDPAKVKGWIKKHDILNRYPNLSVDDLIHEAIAEEFSQALEQRRAPSDSFVGTAFRKIVRFLKAIAHVLNGRGFQTSEDIFGAAMAGKLADRMVQRQPGYWETASFEQKNIRQRTAQGRAHLNSGMAGSVFIPDRRVWEGLTQANAGVWSRLRAGLDGAKDALDRGRVVIQDRMLPLLRAQEAIIRAGGTITDDQNAYAAETTFSGRAGRRLWEINEDFAKPIIDIIAKSKGTLTVEEVDAWLYARHAEERNKRIAMINPGMPDGGSGMPDAEAQQILADAAAGPNAARLTEIARLIDALRERTLTLREDTGLITHDEADLWRKMYSAYVPLKGWAETDHSEATLDMTGTGRRLNVQGAETRRALGRQSQAFSPLQAALTQAQEVAIRASKNEVGQAMVELVENHPAKAMWAIKKLVQKQFFNRSTGMVETRIANPLEVHLEPNEMAVKVAGKEVRIAFKDERLARALGNVGADQMGGFVRMFSMFGRYFSMTRTMLTPKFVLTNAIRDFETAQFNIQALDKGQRGRLAIAMARDWRKALVGAFRGMGNNADTEWTRHFRDFQKAGGQVSFWTLEQPESAKADLDRQIYLATGSRTKRIAKVMTSPRAFFSVRDNAVLGFIERTNLAVDNAIRLAAFVEAKKLGMSSQEAAALAKELTTNFNRRGEMGATLNAFFPFFNAAVQGSTRTLKALSAKRVAKMAFYAFAVGAVNDLINAAVSDEDDDGELFYDKIPDYESERKMHLAIWGFDGGPAGAIPMAYGYNIFPYAGQQLGKVMRGVKAPEEALADVAAAIFGSYSPVQGTDLTSTLTPTVLKPALELATNKTWTGSSIYPYDDPTIPDSQKYYDNASEASKFVAEALNAITGGDDRQSGFVDWSPETIDHLAAFAVGSAGTFWGKSADGVAKAMMGKFDDIENPMGGVLSSKIPPWFDQTRYRLFGADVNDAAKDAKAYKDSGRPVPADVARRAYLYPAYLKAQAEIRGTGDFNQTSKSGMRKPQRDPKTVALEFNRKYIDLMGKQAE